jgi:hypothetical protein
VWVEPVAEPTERLPEPVRFSTVTTAFFAVKEEEFPRFKVAIFETFVAGLKALLLPSKVIVAESPKVTLIASLVVGSFKTTFVAVRLA